jgi:hypothetical protein
MAREGRGLEIRVLSPQAPNRWQLDWPMFSDCDVLFLQRPHAIPQLMAAKDARRLGIPVWLDWDDDLLAAEKSNPASEGYRREMVEPILRR